MAVIGAGLGVALAVGLALGAMASLRAAWLTIVGVSLVAVVVTVYEIGACGEASSRCEAPVLMPLGLAVAVVVFLGVGAGRALRRRG